MAHNIQEYDQHTDRFSAPIARELVHRRAVAEVFVTDIFKTGPTAYTLSAQWPRWHVFFGSLNHGFDSALVIESLRQMTVLIAHTQLHVPMSGNFLMPNMSVSMAPGIVQDPTCPAEVTAEVQVSEIRKNSRGVAAFRTDAVFTVDGQRIADATAGARIVDPENYRRIRSRNNLTVAPCMIRPVPATNVGHRDALNVVLGENLETGCWPLRVDVTNPILFDHPLDHVPGVLLIEAIRQAARVTMVDPFLDFSSIEVQFLSITEFGDEAVVVLDSMAAADETVTLQASIRASANVRMQATARFTAKQQARPAPSLGPRLQSVATGHPGQPDNLGA